MRIGTIYQPSEWQERFHRLRVDQALGAGAVGPGKSMCLLMDPMEQIFIEAARVKRDPAFCGAQPGVKIPGTDVCLWDLILENPLDPGESRGKALHLRRRQIDLDETLDRAADFFPKIDPGVKAERQNGKPLKWRFSSGYTYIFGHCTNKSDYGNFKSLEYTYIVYDELSQMYEEQYDQINTRLRTTDPVLIHFQKIRAMSNPVQESDSTANDPLWVRRRFVDEAPEGNKVLVYKFKRRDGTMGEETRIYLPARLYDNPCKEYVADYEDRLQSKKKHIRDALLNGNWYVREFSFYGEVWDPDRIVVEPFMINREWRRFRSMDWGFKQPGAVVWCAVDGDDNLVVEREYTFKLKKVPEVAAEIKQIEKDMGLWDEENNCSGITGPADNQLWENRGDDITLNKGEHFEALGIPWVKADKRTRKRDAEILYGRLNDNHDPTVPPGIVFFRGCSMCVQTIPVIGTKEADPDCPEDGGPDHWHDAVLYACAYASHGYRAIPKRRRTWMDEDDEYDRRQKRARRRGRMASSMGYSSME
mgnify:FL=1